MRAYEYVVIAPRTEQPIERLSGELLRRHAYIEALWMSAQGDGAVCRLVTDATSEAVAAINAAGYTVSGLREVLVYEFPDRPGILAEISHRASGAGLTLTSVYRGAHGDLVLGCDDLAALEKAVASDGTDKADGLVAVARSLARDGRSSPAQR